MSVEPKPWNGVALSEGDTISSFDLETCLGSRANEVWIATFRDSKYAIKLINEDEKYEEMLLESFRLETAFLDTASHPSFPTYIESGITADHRPYYVMEYIDGSGLFAYMRQMRRVSLEAVWIIFDSLLDAFEYMHDKGWVYGDVKLSNMILSGPRVKLVDFGSSYRPGIDTRIHELTWRCRCSLGTAGYQSPEQIIPWSNPDHRADIWGLGALFFHLATGTYPVHRMNALQILTFYEQLTPDTVASLRAVESFQTTNFGLPPMIAMEVDQALAQEPRQRHQSIAEFRNAFARFFG